MNWIQENKFVSGLIGVTIVAAAVLVFLLMGAQSQFAETTDQYEQQTAELQRLQGLKPYPEAANLKLLTDQRDAHAAEVQQLREDLVKLKLPKEPISPEQFQDSLRSQVSDIETLAQENGVALPTGFYLGFPAYQGTPPRGEATELLAWELKSIVSVVRILIQSKVASIDAIDREALAQENGAASSPPPPKRGPGANKNAGDEQEQLVQRYPFTISFTCEQSRFRSILNQITKTKEQFLIPRSLKIVNEQLVGPPKGPIGVTGGLSSPNAAEAGSLQAMMEGVLPGETKEAGKALSFIVGTEKVKVILAIDIVDFAMPKQAKGPEAAAR